MSVTRLAKVTGYRSEEELKAYLPDNYLVAAICDGFAVIAGVDIAGWTLDGYVIPRYSSGLMACRELVEAPF